MLPVSLNSHWLLLCHSYNGKFKGHHFCDQTPVFTGGLYFYLVFQLWSQLCNDIEETSGKVYIQKASICWWQKPLVSVFILICFAWILSFCFGSCRSMDQRIERLLMCQPGQAKVMCWFRKQVVEWKECGIIPFIWSFRAVLWKLICSLRFDYSQL